MVVNQLDALRCSSSLPLQSIFPLLRSCGVAATIVEPSVIFSLDHLSLAAALTGKSMADGTAVSARPEMEFLMWLACAPHADKAIERAGAKKSEDFILVVLGDKKAGQTADASALAKKLGLAVSGRRRIGSSSSLAFFGVKTPEQLYEKMALSRI